MRDFVKELRPKQRDFILTWIMYGYLEAKKLYSYIQLYRLSKNPVILGAYKQMVNEYLESQNITINDLLEEYHDLAKDKKAPPATRERVLARLIDWQKAESRPKENTPQLPSNQPMRLQPARDVEPRQIECKVVESVPK